MWLLSLCNRRYLVVLVELEFSVSQGILGGSFVSLEGNVSWNTIPLIEFLPSEKGQVYVFLLRKPRAT